MTNIELDATKSMTWKFHVDDSQGNNRYDMMLGCDIMPKLKIYLFLSNNKSRVNRGAYKICMAPYLKN